MINTNQQDKTPSTPTINPFYIKETMTALTPKEEQIARIAQTTALANAFQNVIVEAQADVGMAVEAALMIIRGAAKQCPSVEMRCGLLDYMNQTLQEIVKMNHSVHQAHPVTPDSPAPTLQ